MADQPTQEQTPLRCPDCGYNLTGSCTVESPTGDCPECGLAFERKVLIEQRRRRAKFSLTSLIIELLLFPILIGSTALCGGAMSDAFFANEPSTGVFVFLILGPPLFCAFLVAGLLSNSYYTARVGGIPPERRRGLKRHIILPWLLFFLIEVVLTAVYFIGGCAVIIVVLFR